MRSDQIRRLENLEKEKAGPTRLQARLRQWASRLGVPEKAFLRAAECYVPSLRGELGGNNGHLADFPAPARYRAERHGTSPAVESRLTQPLGIYDVC